MLLRILTALKWFVVNCLSDSGAVSFGRTMSAIITIYYLAQNAWFYHRTGHLVDNGTLLTEASLMTMFYLSTKGAGLLGGTAKNPSDPEKPNQ